MTCVTISNENGTTLIDVVGHAEYNPGNDVVCAAISTICYVLINYFQRMFDNDELKDFSYEDTAGDFHIRAEKNFRYNIQFRCCMDMFTMGLEMIAERFPDNLMIEDE